MNHRGIPNCPKCGSIGIYAEYYDSFYCKVCNIWLESKCSDPLCSFCSKRPEFPKDKMGKVVNFNGNGKRVSGKNE